MDTLPGVSSDLLREPLIVAEELKLAAVAVLVVNLPLPRALEVKDNLCGGGGGPKTHPKK